MLSHPCFSRAVARRRAVPSVFMIGRCLAESEGFEPSPVVTPDDDLADRCLTTRPPLRVVGWHRRQELHPHPPG